MQILAIDPGIANTGWAASNGMGGTLTTQSGILPNKRICQISFSLYNTLVNNPPTTVVIEDTFGPLLKQTTMLLGGLMVAFSKANFVLVPPNKWLKDLFGHDKKGMYKELTKRLVDKMGKKYNTQHQADALGILHWYQTIYLPQQKAKIKSTSTKAKRARA